MMKFKRFTSLLVAVLIVISLLPLSVSAVTELNVTEIALQVGFSTSSYFIQQFKQVKNMSPKKFRKKFMETESKGEGF